MPQCEEIHFEIVFGERADAAHAVHVLGRLLHHHVDDIVMGDDADHAALVVHHRNGQEVIAGQLLGHEFGIVRNLDGHHLGFHEVLDQGMARRQDQIAQGDDAQQLAIVVQNKDVINGLAFGGLEAEAFQGVCRLDGGRQPGVIRGHNAARGMLAMLEQGGDVLAVGLVHQAEQVVGHHRIQAAQQFHPVVVRHLLDQVGHALAARPLHHLDLPVDREILEDGGLVGDGGVFEKAPDLLDVQLAFQGLGDGGRMQRLAKLAHLGLVVFGNHQPNFRTE